MALAFLAPKTPLERPKIDEENAWIFFGGDFKTYFIEGNKERFTSRQIFKAGSPHTGSGRQSTATPPYHYHLYQTETFAVQSGTLCYYIDGKEGKLAAGETAVIPPFRKHTFWNDPEAGTDLDVHITVEGGPNPGFDETFVHNFYGYLSSRTMQGLKPNPLQMLTFLYSADVILADLPLGRFVSWLFGGIIGPLFGFQSQYKEFADD